MNEGILQYSRKIEKELCEKSFYEFAWCAFRETHNKENFTPNWHIQYIADLVQVYVELRAKKTKKGTICPELFKFGFEKYLDLVINVPPRSLKSFLLSVFLVAWTWIRFPFIKFMCNSHTFEKLSIPLSKQTRKLIESEWFVRNWGEKVSINKGDNQNWLFTNTVGGYRMAVSTNGNITGSGANFIIPDDTMSKEMSMSEKEIENTENYILKDLPTRFNDPELDLFMAIEQRLITRDLTGIWIEIGKEFNHVCLPAELTNDVKPIQLAKFYKDGLLFPGRLSRAVLEEKKKELGESYIGQYLQTPVKEGGNILKSEWFEKITEKDIPMYLDWCIFVDTAFTRNLKNDPTGLIICALNNNKIVIKFAQSKHLEVHEIQPHIELVALSHGLHYGNRIIIEAKASGIGVIQDMQRTSKFPVIAFKSLANMEKGGLNDASKMYKANFAASHCEAKRIQLIECEWNSHFLTQLESFPNGTHDEYIDLLAYAIDFLITRARKAMQ